MKIFQIIALLFILSSITACGTGVQVPPAHVGKVLTKNGYAPETIPPSKFRLPACFMYCDRLVLLEASDSGFREPMKLFMPKDKLNLDIDVRGTLSIPTDSNTVDSIYDRVVAQPHEDSATSIIKSNQVYKTYGQQALRGIVRSELSKHTIQEIIGNREVIGQNIHKAINDKLKATKTPLVVSRFELADIQPPAVIVSAQEAAKQREIDVQKAEADAQVELTKAELALEIAKKDRLVEREKAEAIAEQNRIAADSITPEVLAYKKLETAQIIYTRLAESSNTIIVPADSSSFQDVTSDAVLAKLLGGEIRRTVTPR